MDRDRIERALREIFVDREEIACAYLFGSIARGDGRPGSDADVGVLFVEDPPRTLAGIPSRLQADLTAAAGRPVDLVVLNRAPVDLVKRVLRDGRLIVDRDRSRRIAFEVRSRNLYWDLEPILRRYRHPHPGTP